MPDPKVPGEMTGKMMPLSERLAREKEFSKELVKTPKKSYMSQLPESARKFMIRKIMEKNKANFLKNNKADYLKGK